MELKNYNHFNKDGWTPDKPVPSRENMIAYLSNHFRYWTCNSWNRSTSYANCVKLDCLGLADENVNYDKAFDFLFSENSEYDFDVRQLISDFKMNNPGYDAGFNGRSSGYLVLYTQDYNKKGELVTYPGRSFDDDLDSKNPKDIEAFFDELDNDEIASKFRIVKAFDTLCDDIRSLFISYVNKTKSCVITCLKPEERNISFNPDEIDDAEEDLGRIMRENVPDYRITVMYDKIDEDYKATVDQLGIRNINAESLELAVMRAQLAILEYCDANPDAPEPANKR